MMDNIQLLDAVERYIRGEMTSQERVHFEQLRKSNPEVDQLVVEHTIFLNQLDKFGNQKQFKASLHDVHNSLFEAGLIKEQAPRTKVIDIFKKHKKILGVAATIAGIIALTIAGMSLYYFGKVSDQQLQELKSDLRQVDRKANAALNAQRTTQKAPENVPALSGGTGFLIDGKGLLVTNAHVVKDATSLIVQNTKAEQFRARTIYVNPVTDIAIIKIDDDDFKSVGSLPYGIRKGSADLGEPLFTLGFPREEIVYNEGYMSAKTGFKGDTMTCQIGVSANPGNSGGPVFNKHGEVIGIINTRLVQAEGVVFAITAKNIFTSLEELKKDTAFQNLKLPTASNVKGMDRTTQVKKIEDCIFMVKSY
jgi:serine protease Do